MKKFFNLRNIILLGGALLVLVAFFLSFAATFTFTNGGGTATTWFNFVWGANKSQTGSSVVYASEPMEPAIFPFIGLILFLVGMIAAVLVALLVKKPFAKFIVAGCAAIVLAGAIMQFFVIDSAARCFVHYLAKELDMTDEQIKLAIEQYTEHFKEVGAKSVVCVVMGVLGITGALAIGASQFLPEKK